ncbi:hypothetical protein VCUG_01050 [Vavraia culicis subsp. floridensis]|uniref:Uncharacterized protein n=1 Tax=Vavraia culicis (isolate floridensis) TaxID=948595 RepID=L2GW50_VAVCU|nr:uncharacterized protein VCUG_01050 [Vavraia culicis subsp. floridensis]ELA47518.1 hypothetical protein VCUG_01050 [Vavraia culicis subsp. floridensis]
MLFLKNLFTHDVNTHRTTERYVETKARPYDANHDIRETFYGIIPKHYFSDVMVYQSCSMNPSDWRDLNDLCSTHAKEFKHIPLASFSRVISERALNFINFYYY